MFARFMKRTREAIPAGRVMPRLSASRSHRPAESFPTRPGATRGRGLPVAVLLLALVALVALPDQAAAQGQAPVTVAADWSLIPSGLGAGDSFRLIFISSTNRNGSSTDIANYNTFIAGRAAAGHAAIQAYADQFKVVGCTADTDARDNTATTYTSTDKGVPIYWLNGSKVADDYENFYDGSWDNEGNSHDRDESGSNTVNTTSSLSYPITGCGHDGTESFASGTSVALGSTLAIHQGRPGASGATNGPLSSGNFTNSANARPMYGLSPVFTVTDPTAGICGRTQAVQTAILGKISGVSACADVTTANLAAITGQLNLANKSLAALAAGDFAGLTALTRLRLNDNALTGLPDGVFDELTALTRLELNDNALTALPDGVFDELTALTVLELQNNALTALPAGVFDQLTELTTLDLQNNALASLPDGVFDTLTELTTLSLFLNALASLPAGVFDTLTKLTSLDLSDNQLSSLRAGVFDQLTMLLSLNLGSNQLSTLPDRVFEKLTSLVTLLDVSDNPGSADFVPTAMAAATPATLPTSGGAVALDATGSGGAWGTNVTYGWALTDPSTGVTVTYAPDAASAMTTATVPGSLTDGSTLTFTLTVTGRGVDAPDTDTVDVGVADASTDATLSGLALEDGDGNGITLDPVFAPGTTSYTAAVVNRIDTVTVTATKNEDDATVAITDDDDAATPGEAEFSLVEGENIIEVVVTAEDGTTTSTYTITATRATLPPAPSDCPSDTDWCATLRVGYDSGDTPAGLFEIYGYDYAVNFGDLSSNTFSYNGVSYNVTELIRLQITASGTVTTDTLTLRLDGDLPDSTVLQVGSQTFTVGADSDKSEVGLEQWDLRDDPPPAWTGGENVTVSLTPNNAPVFANASETRSFDETIGDAAVSTTTDIGAVFTATDADGDTLTYTLEGADSSKFTIDPATGQIKTKVGEKYSYEDETSYEVTVKADDGNGGADTVDVTLNVADQDEAPVAPAAPSVSATSGSTTSLDVSWSAPDNDGRPAITNYDLRYREDGETGWTDGPQDETGTSASIGSLTAGASYQVQVRATNNEGDSPWSTAGSGSTNNAPVTVAADWSLIPSGLGAGDSFRLIFISSTKRNGSSTDIATYNTFIAGRAAAGHTAIQVYQDQFKVVGCTAGTDARDNTTTTYTSTDKGVPIYWLSGSKVADDYEDFYDGSWDNESNSHDRNESGSNSVNTASVANYPITGCDHDGTEALLSGDSLALGSTSTTLGIRQGRPGNSDANNGPVSSVSATARDNQRPMYGLSPVFTVADATDATLSGLELEDGTGNGITLDPVFAPGTTSYTAAVVNRIDTVTVTATKNDDNATVAITDDDDAATPGEAELSLGEGENIIEVVVTAEDGTTTSTYTITATRATLPPAPSDCPSDTDWCATLRVGYRSFDSILGFFEEYGYVYSSNLGDLSSNTFSYNGLSYAVTELERSQVTAPGDTVTHDKLSLWLDRVLPDGTVLQMGSLTYTLDVDSHRTSEVGLEVWDLLDDPPPAWTLGENITVSLKIPPPNNAPTTLVDNWDVGADSSDLSVSANDRGQRFRTGDNPTGYVLTSIDIDMTSGLTSGDFTVSLWSANNLNLPDTLLATFNNPGNLSTAGTKNFTAPADTPLASDTRYIITFEYTSGATPHINTRNTTSVSSSSASGWSLDRYVLKSSGGDWEVAGQVRAIRIRIFGNLSNNSPGFANASETRSFDETIGDAAVSTASDIGAVVTATDPDSDTLTYTLEGADSSKFTIDPATGQIKTKVGETYSYEDETSYEVTVKADDGNGGTDTVDVTINVADQDEAPVAPAAPSVSATSGSTTSLDVSWSAPVNTGRPAITNYDLRYREDGETGWTDGPQDETGTSASIGSLTAGASYQVQVRATNNEGDSPWSTAGSGSTGNPSNNAPVFANDSETRSFDETIGDAAVSTASDIGAVFTATDADGDTLTYTLEGADSSKFTIVSASGQIKTKVGETYSYEDETSYEVTVKADDGNGGADTVDVTLNVLDVFEAPAAPAAPSVSATSGSTTSLDVSWSAPDNDGRPAITSYDLRYRQGNSGSWTNGPQDETGTSASIGSLTADASYQVQVRATNDEGDSPWSNFGSGSTGTAATTVSIAAVASSVIYRDGSSHVRFTVTRTGATDAALDVTVNLTQDRSFLEMADLEKTVTIAAGDASKTLRISSNSLDIPLSEPLGSGTVTATVAAGTGYDVGTPNTASVAVLVFLTIRLDMASYTVDEGAGTLTVKMIAQTGDGAPAPTGSNSIQLSTVGVTAQFGQDYTASSESATFVAGDFTLQGTAHRAEKTVSVVILDDEMDEPDEVFNLTLEKNPFASDYRTYVVNSDFTRPEQGKPLSPVTIVDNDLPILSVSPATALEGEALEFAVTLSAASADAVTVAYAATGVTATAGTDFTAPGSGATLTIPAGDTTATITIETLADTVDEDAETLTLTLSAPQNATLGTATATGTIDEMVVDVSRVIYMRIEPDPNSNSALTVKWRSVYLISPEGVVSERIPDYDIQYAEELSGWPYRVDGEDWLTVTYPRWINGMTWQGWSGTIESLAESESERGSVHYRARLAGLTEGQAYRIRIRARTAEGPGPWSFARPGVPGGSQATALEPLTVALEDLPESHDGSDAFTVRLAFSDEVALDEAGLRAALLVSNGAVTGVSSVSADLWDITITPAGNANVQLLLSPTSDCEATGAICTDDGRMLSAGLGASVPFVPQTAQQQTLAPLTASFSAAPAEHDGSSRFTVRLAFSEEVKAGIQKVKAALTVTGGTVKKARRVAPPGNEQWTITIQPDGHGAVTIILPITEDCDATGAICTEDGRKLSTELELRVSGPGGGWNAGARFPD